MDRCGACGARLARSVSWCTLCLQPIATVGVARPNRPGSPGYRPWRPAGELATAVLPDAAAAAAAVTPALALRVAAPPPPPTVDPSESSFFVRAHTAPWGHHPRSAVAAPVETGAAPTGQGTAMAVAVILLNVLVQGGTYGLERAGRIQPDTAVSIGLWVGLVFYGVAFLLARAGAAATRVRPRWTVGDPATATWVGLGAGAAASVVVLGLQSLATHQLVGDPMVRLVVSDGGMSRILAAVLLFVGVGPVVEELVFRAVLAESLRQRGTRLAVGVSSVLFALAHLRPSALVYYTLMGVLLGRLYFRRGLRASIAAHAAFNGCLVALAIVSVIGPAKTFAVDGARLSLPAAWHEDATPPAGARAAIGGPSGSELIVVDRPVPAGTVFRPEAAVAAARAGWLPLPDGAAVTDARPAAYPAGPAVVVSFSERGQAGEAVTIVRDDRAWVLVLATAGSERAQHDVDTMLESSLQLP